MALCCRVEEPKADVEGFAVFCQEQGVSVLAAAFLLWAEAGPDPAALGSAAFPVLQGPGEGQGGILAALCACEHTASAFLVLLRTRRLLLPLAGSLAGFMTGAQLLSLCRVRPFR